MKKFTSFLLTFVILISFLSSCNNSPVDSDINNDESTSETINSDVQPMTDIWDGSVASNFSSGDGTETNPYKISTAAELAFLAKSVNEGESYCGKYLVLNNNIDLNNLEWTPIGNGNYPFSGHFNGNYNTITNLKLTDVSTYKHKYTLDEFEALRTCGVAGLFGYSLNATFSNLIINNSSISISEDITSTELMYLGILCGYINSTIDLNIINVKIFESEIHIFDDNISGNLSSGILLYAGGIIGNVNIGESAQCNISTIQSNVTISVDNTEKLGGHIETLYVGGISGSVVNHNYFACSDFASYLTAYFSEYSKNYAGAFGHISTRNFSKLSDGFSEVKISHPITDLIYPDYFYKGIFRAHAIVGCDLPSIVSTTYEFENLFGCVKPIDNMNHFEPICKLYLVLDISSIARENNCHGCTSLPQNHGLNENVWNLTSDDAPVLK